MRQKAIELEANSLIDAIKHAQDWMRDNSPEDICWFRGVKDNRLSLLPGAYWREGYNEWDTLLRFSQEGRAFADVGEIDDWKTYYLAQHNGIPTRLLDWTENFISALFFATDGWDGVTTPCVWIIRPCYINQLSIGWSGLVSPERNEELTAWAPTRIKAGAEEIRTKDGEWVYDSAKPLALYPRKNNARLVAQQGTFTVHGTLKTPLDEWIIEQEPATHASVLCKVVFTQKVKRGTLVSELDDLGLRRSTIYSDLANFVLELKDRNGWK
jgi:FRG domain